jgi:hypothetical protein
LCHYVTILRVLASRFQYADLEMGIHKIYVTIFYAGNTVSNHILIYPLSLPSLLPAPGEHETSTNHISHEEDSRRNLFQSHSVCRFSIYNLVRTQSWMCALTRVRNLLKSLIIDNYLPLTASLMRSIVAEILV